MRRVTLTAFVRVRRPKPTPAEAQADLDAAESIRGVLQIDLDERARKLEALLNREV